MTIVTRATAKSYFELGDKPSQSQFEDLIDSSMFNEDFSSLGKILASAATTAAYQQAIGGGTVGRNVFEAITTASAQNNLGGGAVGKNLFEATTTASGQNQLGAGTVGKFLFETITTASGQNQLGAGAVGAQIFSAITTASATNILLGSGTIVQIVNFQTGAVATGTTTIPQDDTIPQITEGNEYMTLAITPSNSSNKLRIQVVAKASFSASPNWALTMALFQDSTADALNVSSQQGVVALGVTTLVIDHVMTAGTTSSTTFRIRIGANAAGTTTFNGQNGARLYGGSFISSITITEIKV